MISRKHLIYLNMNNKVEENTSNPLSREVRVSIGNAVNFVKYKPVTMPFNQILKLVTNPNKTYSFSWYRNNYRALRNVIPGVDVIALDFDNCPKVLEIIEEKFDKYYGFIAPTRSYMKNKGGICVPRYRVILLLQYTLFMEPRNYSQAYANMVDDLQLDCASICGESKCLEKLNYACDVAVKDPTRLFYGAEADPTLIRPLRGGEYLPFDSFDYARPAPTSDLEYLTNLKVDINQYRNIDMSQYENLNPSLRYECPICAMADDDPNKHHLGLSADGKYITCFFNEEHSHILRKLKNMDLGNFYTEDERISYNMAKKLSATPDIFKFKWQNPKPSKVDILKVQRSFDESLKYFQEHHDLLGLDIETFTQEIPEYTRDQVKDVYNSEYSGILTAYDIACGQHLCNGFDNYNIKTRLVSLTHQTIDPHNPNPTSKSIPFDLYIMHDDQKKELIKIIRETGMAVGHNLKFDLLTLAYNFGIDNIMPKYVFDTMLGARIDQMARDVEPVPAGNGLEACLWRYCGIKVNKAVEHSWGNSDLDLVQLHYSIHDTSYLPQLMNAEIKSLRESLGTFSFEKHPRKELEFLGPLLNIHPVVALEMQFLRELVRIEYNGVQPDLKMLRESAEKYYKNFYKVQDKLGINLNSPIQFRKWLQDNIDPSITTTSGKVIDPLYIAIPEYEEVSDARKEYKRAVLMDAMTCVKGDGRIHPQFNQLLNTGRQACKNPNCIAEGQPILMANGTTKAIQLIKKGDYVLSQIGTSEQLCKMEVLEVIDNGYRVCNKYRFIDDNQKMFELVCTPDHLINTTNGWTKARYITENHIVYGASGLLILDSVQGAGIQRVYDLTVERYHNFFANWINVHNCQQIPQQIKHSVYATRGHDWFYEHDENYRKLFDRKMELEKQIAQLESTGT